MPYDDSSGTFAQISGNNGQRLFNQTHEDIDSSDVEVTCLAGSCRVVLHERIWSSWRKRNEWLLGLGQVLNTSVVVDSAVYDGDHRVRVFATANGTSCIINFDSTDD
jgi:hypothetical protein